jgi:hypothetical protein
VGAAEDKRVDAGREHGLQILAQESFRFRVFDGAVLYPRHQAGACLGVNRHSLCKPFNQPRKELALKGGPGGDDTHMPAARSLHRRLDCRFHAYDGQVEVLPQMVEGGRRCGVAGDYDKAGASLP